MKKVIVLLTLVAAASAYSQGLINFNNRNTSITPNINAPIKYAATPGNPRGDASDISINGAGSLVVGSLNWGGQFAQAGLYGSATSDPASMQLLTPSVGFRSGAAAGFVNVGSAGERSIAAVAPAANGYFQIRAWDIGQAGASSYEAALGFAQRYAGVSQVIHVGPLGGGSPALPAANLVDMDTGLAIAGFSINYVPEPSIIGLGILGAAAALVVFRRRE